MNQDERRQLLRRSLELSLWWFADTTKWPYGRDLRDAQALSALFFKCQNELESVRLDPDFLDYRSDVDLLDHLLGGDMARMKVWLNPLQDSPGPKPFSEYSRIVNLIEPSRLLHAKIFVRLATDHRRPQIKSQLLRTMRSFLRTLLYSHEAMHFLIAENTTNADVGLLKVICKSFSGPNFKQCLLYGDATSPTSALTYFLPGFRNNPFILQYAMRSMSSHRIEVMFFYVPQIVQAVRHDSMRTLTQSNARAANKPLGYVKQYILEAGSISQLFAHQIIWNIDANSYKDDDSLIPDDIKQSLDVIKSRIISNLTGEKENFYEREFEFFSEVTSISGKLRPFIKKTKAEKKVYQTLFVIFNVVRLKSISK